MYQYTKHSSMEGEGWKAKKAWEWPPPKQKLN